MGLGILSLSRAANTNCTRPRGPYSEVLAKHALPHIKPLLLLRREQLARHAERAREHVAEPRPQVLDNEQGLPVGHAEAGAVAVKDHDARVHVDADVAAEEGDGEVFDGCGFVGVEEPIARLVSITRKVGKHV